MKIQKLNAKQQYQQAQRGNLELQATCVNIKPSTFEKWMKGTVKADGKKIRQIIKKELPDLYKDLQLNFYNPFEKKSKRREGLLVYVHSGIEYFLTY